MGSMVQIDESALMRILAFMNEVRGRLCCKSWAKHLFTSLQLEHRIRFNKLVQEKGKIGYHHSAVRPYGQDFEECVTYQFEFFASKTYALGWNRSFGQWSAANERQVGCWEVVGNVLRCESTEGPEVPDRCVKYAEAGRVFELPIDTICSGNSVADAKPFHWEFQVRGTPIPESSMETSAFDARVWTPPAARLQNEETRFVEIDGELYEVSGDIRTNYPESDWQRLMRCRIRFGLGN